MLDIPDSFQPTIQLHNGTFLLGIKIVFLSLCHERGLEGIQIVITIVCYICVHLVPPVLAPLKGKNK